MKISIVIPNYNGEKILEKNLSRVVRVLEESKEDIEIIISDDASTDTSVQILQSFIDHTKTKIPIQLVTSSRNKGFSSNVNKGVAAASGEVVVLLNTDVIPEKGFLQPLLTHFSDPSIFAVGCMDKSKEGDTVVLRGRGLGKWKKGFLIHSRGEVDMNNTLWVSGGSGAFKKSIWDKLGGLDTLYNPYYWEDIDISYRAVKSGYSIVFEPKSTVIHEHDTGSIKTQHSNDKISSRAYRNQFIFIWKNVTDTRLMTEHILWLPIHVVKAVARRDLPYLQGLWDAFLSLPAINKSKTQARKNFTRSDVEVLMRASSE